MHRSFDQFALQNAKRVYICDPLAHYKQLPYLIYD